MFTHNPHVDEMQVFTETVTQMINLLAPELFFLILAYSVYKI